MLILLFLLHLLLIGDQPPQSRGSISNRHRHVVIISDALPVQFWLSNCQTYNELERCGVHHACYCAPWNCLDVLRIQFTDDSEEDFSLRVVDAEGTELFEDEFDRSDDLYSASFQPQAIGICDKEIQVRIIKNSSPEEEVAKSDCLDVRTSHDCTLLLTYSNTRNYAGLVYSNQSPEVSFDLRIPAIFFHERFVEEDKGIELSNSRTITTSSVMKAQRLLETGYIPYYMHRKIMLALKHQNVEIYGRGWIKEEPYEVVEGDRRWPLKKGKVLLTEKNFVIRNTL